MRLVDPGVAWLEPYFLDQRKLLLLAKKHKLSWLADFVVSNAVQVFLEGVNTFFLDQLHRELDLSAFLTRDHTELSTKELSKSLGSAEAYPDSGCFILDLVHPGLLEGLELLKLFVDIKSEARISNLGDQPSVQLGSI